MGGGTSKLRGLSDEERIQAIKNTPFFLYLEDLSDFARCFPSVIVCKEGQTVDLDPEKLYIVAKGELTLRTTLPQDGKVDTKSYLCKKCYGDIISKLNEQQIAFEQLRSKKLSLLVDRIETFACEKTFLLCSDTKAFDAFLAKNTALADPFHAITSSHIGTYLSRIPFLEGVKESQLSVLAAMCRYEAVDKDKVVIEEGAPGDKLYIMLSGMAVVLSPRWKGSGTALQQSLEWGLNRSDNEASGESVEVANLKSGDYFGESALFVDINRMSTVKVKEKSLFVTVEKRQFENFCAVCPIKNSMTRVMKERMVGTFSSLGIPFFVGIPADSLKSLANLVEIHEMNDNDVIFREGDKGDKFYIIVQGEVKVEKSASCGNTSPPKDEDIKERACHESLPENLGVLNAGNYFGEVALASDIPRSATVIAIGKGILLSVDKENFQTIFASNATALAEFELRLLKNESKLRHVLSHPLGMSAFRSYLKRNVAEENLDFWVAATEFRNSEVKDSSIDMVRTAKDIYDKYCKEGADLQVNLPCSIRSNIEKILEEKSVDETIFLTAADEIYHLMVKDQYARFKRTPDFEELFKCLGVLCMIR